MDKCEYCRHKCEDATHNCEVATHNCEVATYKCEVVTHKNNNGWFGSAKSDSTHHFFGNASTKSGSLQFPQLSGC
jgi:hypothetical protein